ncbi:MAG: phosphoribosylformylglycinamidine synthase subunit PurS, partial [Dehalococcoidales bacterium]|nr:phosphoribosylformylglycinamidine synthase subunit PurS [Dehalococcoidales bacterium]
MHRIEVCLKPGLPDVRGSGLVKDISDLGITTVSRAHVSDIYWLNADLTDDELGVICRNLLADPVTQDYSANSAVTGPKNRSAHTVEVAYNAGVTDPVEESLLKAIRDLGLTKVKAVKTARKYVIEGQLDDAQLETIARRLLVNPIIQHAIEGEHFAFPENPQYEFKLQKIAIGTADR